MFKPGDRVIYFNYKSKYPNCLTLNKLYIIISIDYSGKFVCVKNDIGNYVDYNYNNFIYLNDYRKEKIKRLCSKLEIR